MRVTGTILVNGKRVLDNFKFMTGYVAQVDITDWPHGTGRYK